MPPKSHTNNSPVQMSPGAMSPRLQLHLNRGERKQLRRGGGGECRGRGLALVSCEMTCEASAWGKPVYSTQGKGVRVNGGQSITYGESSGGGGVGGESRPAAREASQTGPKLEGHCPGGQGCALSSPAGEHRAWGLRVLRGPARPVEAPWLPCPAGSVGERGLRPPEASRSRRKRSA